MDEDMCRAIKEALMLRRRCGSDAEFSHLAAANRSDERIG